jgi:hypothetical protein
MGISTTKAVLERRGTNTGLLAMLDKRRGQTTVGIQPDIAASVPEQKTRWRS